MILHKDIEELAHKHFTFKSDSGVRSFTEALMSLIKKNEQWAYFNVISDVEAFNKLNACFRQEPTTSSCCKLASDLVNRYLPHLVEKEAI